MELATNCTICFLPIIWMGVREGYTGVALALAAVQQTLAAITAFVKYDTGDFTILQLLMLVLSITGLLLRRHDGAPGRCPAPARATDGIGSHGG